MLGAPVGWFQRQFHPVLSVCRSELRACGEESRCVHVFRLRFMTVWMKVIHQMERALGLCSVHEWDMALAYYAGSKCQCPQKNRLTAIV